MGVHVLVLFLVAAASCQTLEDGWKGIQPLRTGKTKVEKILGNPKVIDDNNYHGYRADGVFIQVNYSTAPCAENQYNRGRYNIPADTVLDYVVNLHTRIKLSDLKFEKAEYYRETDHHSSNLVYYTRRDNSIRITAVVQDDGEYAGRISFMAGNSESQKHKCP